ncbi:MAG TPA: CpaD family pilus assembly protein [Methylovirgula sp.]|nr:CpaD family pilus assembly protein [Methylovirgula sp.]
MPISPPRSSTGRAISQSHSRTALRLVLLTGLASTAGCATVDRMKTSSIPMDDYRNRHPIVLAETSQKLDLFPSPHARGLDGRSAAQVEQFGRLYQASGQGPISVFIPTGPHAALPRETVAAIRQALGQSGVRAGLQITRYPVSNPGLASPVRLTFTAMRAKVATPCGQWPSDLASGSTVQGWENKPYWNMGCAYQSMLAEQVADPRDLVGPRAEDPADSQMRTRPIGSLRKGTDPTTDWKTKNTSISSIGNQ